MRLPIFGTNICIPTATEIGSSNLGGVEVSAGFSGGGAAGAQALVVGVTEAVGVAGDGLDHSVGAFVVVRRSSR
jgi:hypothetical protein